jgi:hypothetical protein
MMQVDHRFEENLTPERIDAIIQQLRTDPAPHSAKPDGAKPQKAAVVARSRAKRAQV